MFSSATQPPPPRGLPPPPPPPRHNFVSAITFEGFKLRSSNLTHALLIQISRTSSIIDIVVPSKMAAGGQKWPEMRSKVICVHPKWPPAAILSKLNKKFKLRIDLKWPEMRSKVNLRASKMADQSEMARNAIQSDFQTSKNGRRK